MRARVVLLLLVAAAAGLGTVKFARDWLDGQSAAQRAALTPAPPVVTVQPEPASRYVLVARNELPIGHFVREGDLRWQAWPDQSVPATYLVQGDADTEALLGGVVRSRMGPGDPITTDRIVMPGDRGFLAAVLQPGMRAATVPIDDSTGVAGLVFPGDRVDVLLSHEIEILGVDNSVARDRFRATETVLSDIRILAIDQVIDDRVEDPKVADTVTLEVTPRQAEELRVVLSLGSLSLSLRSLGLPGEDQVAGIPGPDKALRDALRGFGGGGPAWGVAGKSHTFTLDSDVSALISPAIPAVPPPAPPPEAAPEEEAPAEPEVVELEPTVTVFRGSAVR